MHSIEVQELLKSLSLMWEKQLAVGVNLEALAKGTIDC